MSPLRFHTRCARHRNHRPNWPRQLAWLLLVSILFAACGRDRLTSTDVAEPAVLAPGFVLESPVVSDGGALPVKYTCDGASATLPLAWHGAPAGTVSYAVVMHHVPGPGDTHWYWVLYALPASVTSLAENATGVGVLGTNSVNDRAEYAPPCSKGPGPKQYTYTVYALSAPPEFGASHEPVSRAVLLNAIRGRTLGRAVLNVVYSRQDHVQSRPTHPSA